MTASSLICPKCGKENVGAHVHACAFCGEDLFYVEGKFTPTLKLIMWLSFGVGFLFLVISLLLIFENRNYSLYSIIYIPGTINLAIGWGIWKRKYWTRKLAITVWTIVNILNLLSFSLVHVVLGLFIIYTLESPEAKMFFKNK